MTYSQINPTEVKSFKMKKGEKKLKAYFWFPEEDTENGIAVIAYNLKEAKKLGYSWWGCEVGHDNKFIEQRTKLIKDANLDGINKPQVISDIKDGLKRGLYAHVEEDTDCDICFENISDIYIENIYEDKIVCDDCLEKVSKKNRGDF